MAMFSASATGLIPQVVYTADLRKADIPMCVILVVISALWSPDALLTLRFLVAVLACCNTRGVLNGYTLCCLFFFFFLFLLF